MRFRSYGALFALFILAVLCACEEKNSIHIDINKDDFTNDGKIKNTKQEDKPLNLAIAAMTSPNESLKYYNELIHFISKKIESPINIIQRKKYSEINQMLSEGKVDVAFICSGAYINALEKKLPIEILTVPIINSSSHYFSYVIVNEKSGINDFDDLKNKAFAYTDPLSNSGHNYALSLIKETGYKENGYFKNVIYTYAHDYSIQAVERNIVDGACVHSLIFDYIKINNPERISHIKIIKKSEPFGIPPIVISKSVDINIKMKIQKAFLEIHRDTSGKEILKKLMIDYYTLPERTDYSSVLKRMRNSCE